jgi:hypothetical protein
MNEPVAGEAALVTIPRGLATFSARPPAVFLPHPKAAERFFDFFTANIRNKNTRRAYYKAVCRFAEWCETKGLRDLAAIKPFHVAAYIEGLGLSKPTVKQQLAAVRMLFDWLVVGHVLGVNPAHAVRGPKYSVKKGKTPVLDRDDARKLIASIEVVKKETNPDGVESEEPDLVGLVKFQQRYVKSHRKPLQRKAIILRFPPLKTYADNL